MHRWLLLVCALLLVASLVGDVFFVHHHLDDFSVVSEHTPPQYAPNLFGSLIGALSVQGSPLLGSVASWLCGGAEDIVSCFCGWHNSAYLDASMSLIYSG